MSFHFFNVLEYPKLRNVSIDQVTCLIGLAELQGPGQHYAGLLLLPAHLGHGDGELPGQAGQTEPHVGPGQVAAGQGAGPGRHGPQVQVGRVCEDVQVCHETVILMMDI